MLTGQDEMMNQATRGLAHDLRARNEARTLSREEAVHVSSLGVHERVQS